MRFGRQKRGHPSGEHGGPKRTAADKGDDVQEATAMREASSDPTQQLLSALGRFQKQLAAVQAGDAEELWPDECMNQLIGAMEVALSHNWPEVVESLSDTGRVLQSYENAKCPEDALPFLNDAYELLCLMVGDIIVDGVRPGVIDKWTRRYHLALADMDTAGIELASDQDDPDGDAGKSPKDDLPFEMPPLAQKREEASIDDGLSTLDELPPLESMLEMGVSPVASSKPKEDDVPDLADAISNEDMELLRTVATAEAEDEPAEADEIDDAAEASEEPAPLGGQPSRLVVDVMDRICDELGILESAVDGPRLEALRTIEGGLTALKREAREHRHTVSATLAESMLEACRLAIEHPDVVDERFTDLAFAFCGVYVEALEGDTENVKQWTTECGALMLSWDTESTSRSGAPAETPEPEEPFEPLAESAERVETTKAETQPVETEETEAMSQPQPAAAEEKPAPELRVVEAPEAPETVETSPAPAAAKASGSALSNELLAQAQEAAMQGDAQAAQHLALRAAAEIASLSVTAAHNALRDAETRYRTCIDAIEHARETVHKRESELGNADAKVTSGKKMLKSAEGDIHTARVEVENVQTRVDTLTAQIQELQKRREEEIEVLKSAESTLKESENALEDSRREVANAEVGVVKAREQLEFARQDVKAKQRNSAEIESDIARVRSALEEKQSALESIRATLGSAKRDPKDADKEDEEEMLF